MKYSTTWSSTWVKKGLDIFRTVLDRINTHKYVHVAVAVNSLGVYQDDLTVACDAEGYCRLEQWARLLPVASCQILREA